VDLFYNLQEFSVFPMRNIRFIVDSLYKLLYNKSTTNRAWTLCDMDIELMTFNPARPFFSPCR